MTDELKPCPFEKPGETHRVEVIETISGYGYIYCLDCEFAFPSEEELQEADLIQRWNTRTEPTCKMVFNQLAGMYQCSECGTYSVTAAWNKSQGLLNYCMGCGAKVVE